MQKRKQLEETKGNSQGQRIYSIDGESCQLTAQGGGQGAKTGLYLIDPYNLTTPKDQTNATSLRTNYSNGNMQIVENRRIRRLTPIECERLQGFPDNWTKHGHDDKEISDSQRYRCLGNAVSVPVVKIVMERLFNGIRP